MTHVFRELSTGHQKASRGDRRLLVEIAGVAGAGKSTLTNALCDADMGYVRAPFIRMRRPSHVMYLLCSLPRLAPILLVNLVRPPRLSWADVKLMAYVTCWNHFLRRRHVTSGAATLLDQGPIYALVRLRAQGRGISSSRWFQRWWSTMLARWVDALSVLILLEAPDGVLRARIDDRAQSHAVKGAPDEVRRRFIGRYRELFGEVLGQIDGDGALRVRRFDTSETPLDTLVNEVHADLSDWMAAARTETL